MSIYNANEEFSVLCRAKAMSDIDPTAPMWAIAHAIMELTHAQEVIGMKSVSDILAKIDDDSENGDARGVDIALERDLENEHGGTR